MSINNTDRGRLRRSLSARLSSLALVVAALGLAPSAARAEDPPDTCGGQVSDFVDFSKPPNEIEGQNKVRIGIQPITDPKTKLLSLEVIGTAYYPDGVVINLAIRHAKVRTHFEIKKVVVKDHTFTHTFGPFKKSMPGGGLVIEAVFLLTVQSPQVQKELASGNYFHSNPPCKHDKGNLTEVHYSLGGDDAEQAAIKSEKEAIGEARKGLLDAYSVCGAAIKKIEAKEAGPDSATAALARLERDLEAVSTTFNAWKSDRQFVLFPQRILQLKNLRSHMRDALRARAVLAGAPVPGLNAAKAQELRGPEEKEVTRLSDELKAFNDETDSLDKAFETKDDKKDDKAAATPDGKDAKDAKAPEGANKPK